jgi:kynureninase
MSSRLFAANNSSRVGVARILECLTRPPLTNWMGPISFAGSEKYTANLCLTNIHRHSGSKVAAIHMLRAVLDIYLRTLFSQ